MGKRFIFILMACSLLSIATAVHAQHIDKQTYTFAIKKADTLKLDKYVMIDQIQGTQSKPVILFAFGGGFKGGRRDNPDYISYFLYLYATERKRDSILFLYSGRYRTFPILFSYEG